MKKNAFPISRNFFSPGDVNINLTVIPRDSRSVTRCVIGPRGNGAKGAKPEDDEEPRLGHFGSFWLIWGDLG